MPRYWLKIDEAVEGPYESEMLKFIKGFSEDTLVSPDQTEAEEVWLKACEVTELKRIFNIPETAQTPPAPPEASSAEFTPEQPPAISEPAPEKVPELLKEQEPVPTPPPPLPPTILEEVILEKPAPASTELPNLASEKPSPISLESELLDVMQKLSEEIKKEEAEKTEAIAIIPAALPEKHLPELQIQTAVTETQTIVPASKFFKKPAKTLLFLTIFLIGIGGAFWQAKRFRWGKEVLKDWTELLRKKFLSKSGKPSIETLKMETRQPEVISTIQRMEKPSEIKDKNKEIATVEKIVSPSVSHPKRWRKQKTFAAAPAKVVKTTDTLTEPPLKSQKYMLPGVPSPNISSEKISKEPPKKIEDDTELKKTEKQKQAEKQFKEVEQLNQTQWGR